MSGHPSADIEDQAPGLPIEIRKLSDEAYILLLMSGWDACLPSKCRQHASAKLQNAKKGASLTFDSSALDQTDSLVVAMILDLIREAQKREMIIDEAGLPDALRKLIRLSLAVPPRIPEPSEKHHFLEGIGKQSLSLLRESRGFFEFVGELVYSFGKLLAGKARFRKADFWSTLQACGVGALPIVGLISILTGTILGFVGAVQLRKFGATIYMTDLVGLAMAREMGCIMTGIIMSGRTGAAFAAQIGSMNVNEEVDALETLGISPMEFLVMPRALAMVLMMPILTLYADVLGWFGGFIVALPMDISPSQFWVELTDSLSMGHISYGIFKSFFFGIIVASAGCYFGLKSGRNSAAVGEAATKAVVASITWIILLDAAFAFISEALGN